MKLPNAEQALIEADKLRDYLLSSSHPVGRFKATVFMAMGYFQDRWEQLARDLRDQHVFSDVHEVIESPHGMKYVIRASLKGPNGRTLEVVSIWIIPEGEDSPRFVTAYPGEE